MPCSRKEILWITTKSKSAFDDWATTYESDVVPKLDLRGYSYDELAKTILSYYDKSMDKNLS